MLFQLIRADAFLCVNEDRQSHEPLLQRDVRVAKQGSSGGRELMLARWLKALVNLPALVLRLALAGDLGNLVVAADHTANPVRPTLALKEGQALFFGSECFYNVYLVHNLPQHNQFW